MNQPDLKQISLGLRITGFIVASLMLVLASGIFGFSSSFVVLGVVALALVVLLIPDIPRLARRFSHVDFFSPYVVFPIGYIAWFVLGSINIIDVPTGVLYGYFDPIPSWMYALYACGLGGYFCGMVVGHILPITRASNAPSKFNLEKMQRILVVLLVVFLACWMILSALFGITILHPDTANVDRLARRGALYQIFIYFGWTTIIFCPIFVWARGVRKRFDWIQVVALPAIIGILLVSLGAGRSPLLVPLLTVVIARSYFKKQPLWKLAAVAATAFAVLSTLGYLRGRLSSTGQPEIGLMESIGVPPALAPVLDMSADLRFSVAALRDLSKIYPSSRPYQHGAILTLPFTAFLPGHHEMADMVFKETLEHNFQGAGEPATILGPLYVDFGWLGVFVGMSVYGFLLTYIYRRMKEQPSATRIIAYAWLMQCCLWGIFCDGFNDVYIFLMPCFWAVLFLISRMKFFQFKTSAALRPIPHID